MNREEAFDDYKNGVLRFINGEPLRYGSELQDLLNQRGIEYSVDPFGHAYECYDLVMDSLLKIRFGDTFIDKLKLEADSLFFESRQRGTFAYFEVDTWAFAKETMISLEVIL